MEELPIRIDGYYHLENGRKFWKTENKNNSINDLSVKGTYLLNDMLSFYLKANNLLFQKYEFWQGYPAQNFNIMGGVSVKF
jgi:TonB dependent receptor.